MKVDIYATEYSIENDGWIYIVDHERKQYVEVGCSPYETTFGIDEIEGLLDFLHIEYFISVSDDNNYKSMQSKLQGYEKVLVI